MDYQKFDDTEHKYNELKKQLDERRITPEEMKKELKKMMVLDDNGNYWMIGGKSGKWYIYNGTDWVGGNPFENRPAPVQVDAVEDAVSSPVTGAYTDDYASPGTSQDTVRDTGQYEAQDTGQDTGDTALAGFFGNSDQQTENYSVDASDSGILNAANTATGADDTDEQELSFADVRASQSPTVETIAITEKDINAPDTSLTVNTLEKVPQSTAATATTAAEAAQTIATSKSTTPVEKGTEQGQAKVTCELCGSQIPLISLFCPICGVSRDKKGAKKRKALKAVIEEGELVITSIKMISLMFFLGGLGLIVGVLMGATYGIFQEFLKDLPVQLPQMLVNTRGGIAGGLIFAAVGGIAGFIGSAVAAAILTSVYNLIAYLFGGIRLNIKL